MGAGRRMSRKQGPPKPLSDDHYARLKRKAGLPADPPSEPQEKKRRRTTKNASAKSEDVKKPAKKTNGAKPASRPTGRIANGRTKSQPLAVAAEEGSSAEEIGDEFDVEDADALGSESEDVAKLDDEFLGSNSSPESSVFDSEDEGDQNKHVFSEDEDESDAEEKLTAANIAGLSERLDRKLEEQAAANATEIADSALQTNIDGDKPHIFDDGSDQEAAPGRIKTNALLTPDLQLLRTRIAENVRVLDDFAKLAEEGRSRAEYTAQLLKDICAYYGYSEYLAEKLFSLFPPREAFAFFEANETARPVVIRTNSLRTSRRQLAQALINRGVTLEPVGKWSKVGLQVFESSVPLGATPEYLAGHYILQAASSFLPCMALDPQENERVLDMAAAPGGKTTYLAAMMHNTGLVLANDPNPARAKALIGNIHRLGARNVVVCNYDARAFPKPMGGFDRVLLDAPCSGTGVIAKDPSVKTNKTDADFQLLPHTQRQLLLAALDSVHHASSSGGFVVYSTCSVTVEENEQVVQYALNRRPNVRLVDTGLPFGKPGFTRYISKRFDASMKITRRFYPHTYNVDGFFVAKFQKFALTPANAKGVAFAPPAGGTDIVDKTPLADHGDDGKASTQRQGDDFGDWEEDEDKEYMEKARRNAMRRRGLDPRSDKQAKKQPT